MIRGLWLLILSFCFLVLWGCARRTPSVSVYDEIWTTPSLDESGSMPLGNGEIGTNVWADSSGRVWLYIARTDAWDAYCTLLKVGLIKIAITPNPFGQTARFEQKLDLQNGEIYLLGHADGKALRMVISVDANEPVIDIDYQSDFPLNLAVETVIWRDKRRSLADNERHRAYGWINSGGPIWDEPDSLLHSDAAELIWLHHNSSSIWSETLRRQGMEQWLSNHSDPLLNRTFGALVMGSDLEKANSHTLKTANAIKRGYIRIFAHTEQNGNVDQWAKQVREQAARIQALNQSVRRQAHRRWWTAFWQRSFIHALGTEESRTVSRAFALQRFISACAGRGNFPQKFNGSLFTVSSTVNDLPFNADFRRWGGCYWLQNTRLIYWPMLRNGDFDLLQPFFAMYSDALPYARFACQQLYNHSGAFFPETFYFWGSYNLDNFGWQTDFNDFQHIENRYIRYYFDGALEVAALMLAYADYAQDQPFLERVAVPFSWEVVNFYRQHYSIDETGRLRLEPSQALETFWQTINPTPPIAGLHHVVATLLGLPDSKLVPAMRDSLLQVQAVLPDLPLAVIDGQPVILAAERIDQPPENMENPELYASFPYPLFAIGKPDFARLQNTYDRSVHKSAAGWQNADVYAARAGKMQTAKELLVKRAKQVNPDHRFPAFWGPNYDWTPDQDHGSNIIIALQEMLLQADGNKLFLFPAWPTDWDVEFKLHAPQQTVIKGRLQNGKLENLQVTPTSRRDDLIVLLPKGVS